MDGITTWSTTESSHEELKILLYSASLSIAYVAEAALSQNPKEINHLTHHVYNHICAMIFKSKQMKSVENTENKAQINEDLSNKAQIYENPLDKVPTSHNDHSLRNIFEFIKDNIQQSSTSSEAPTSDKCDRPFNESGVDKTVNEFLTMRSTDKEDRYTNVHQGIVIQKSSLRRKKCQFNPLLNWGMTRKEREKNINTNSADNFKNRLRHRRGKKISYVDLDDMDEVDTCNSETSNKNKSIIDQLPSMENTPANRQIRGKKRKIRWPKVTTTTNTANVQSGSSSANASYTNAYTNAGQSKRKHGTVRNKKTFSNQENKDALGIFRRASMQEEYTKQHYKNKDITKIPITNTTKNEIMELKDPRLKSRCPTVIEKHMYGTVFPVEHALDCKGCKQLRNPLKGTIYQPQPISQTVMCNASKSTKVKLDTTSNNNENEDIFHFDDQECLQEMSILPICHKEQAAISKIEHQCMDDIETLKQGLITTGILNSSQQKCYMTRKKDHRKHNLNDLNQTKPSQQLRSRGRPFYDVFNSNGQLIHCIGGPKNTKNKSKFRIVNVDSWDQDMALSNMLSNKCVVNICTLPKWVETKCLTAYRKGETVETTSLLMMTREEVRKENQKSNIGEPNVSLRHFHRQLKSVCKPTQVMRPGLLRRRKVPVTEAAGGEILHIQCASSIQQDKDSIPTHDNMPLKKSDMAIPVSLNLLSSDISPQLTIDMRNVCRVMTEEHQDNISNVAYEALVHTETQGHIDSGESVMVEQTNEEQCQQITAKNDKPTSPCSTIAFGEECFLDEEIVYDDQHLINIDEQFAETDPIVTPDPGSPASNFIIHSVRSLSPEWNAKKNSSAPSPSSANQEVQCINNESLKALKYIIDRVANFYSFEENSKYLHTDSVKPNDNCHKDTYSVKHQNRNEELYEQEVERNNTPTFQGTDNSIITDGKRESWKVAPIYDNNTGDTFNRVHILRIQKILSPPDKIESLSNKDIDMDRKHENSYGVMDIKHFIEKQALSKAILAIENEENMDDTITEEGVDSVKLQTKTTTTGNVIPNIKENTNNKMEHKEDKEKEEGLLHIDMKENEEISTQDCSDDSNSNDDTWSIRLKSGKLVNFKASALHHGNDSNSEEEYIDKKATHRVTNSQNKKKNQNKGHNTSSQHQEERKKGSNETKQESCDNTIIKNGENIQFKKGKKTTTTRKSLSPTNNDKVTSNIIQEIEKTKVSDSQEVSDRLQLEFPRYNWLENKLKSSSSMGTECSTTVNNNSTIVSKYNSICKKHNDSDAIKMGAEETRWGREKIEGAEAPAAHSIFHIGQETEPLLTHSVSSSSANPNLQNNMEISVTESTQNIASSLPSELAFSLATTFPSHVSKDPLILNPLHPPTISTSKIQQLRKTTLDTADIMQLTTSTETILSTQLMDSTESLTKNERETTRKTPTPITLLPLPTSETLTTEIIKVLPMSTLTREIPSVIVSPLVTSSGLQPAMVSKTITSHETSRLLSASATITPPELEKGSVLNQYTENTETRNYDANTVVHATKPPHNSCKFRKNEEIEVAQLYISPMTSRRIPEKKTSDILYQSAKHAGIEFVNTPSVGLRASSPCNSPEIEHIKQLLPEEHTLITTQNNHNFPKPTPKGPEERLQTKNGNLFQMTNRLIQSVFPTDISAVKNDKKTIKPPSPRQQFQTSMQAKEKDSQNVSPTASLGCIDSRTAMITPTQSCYNTVETRTSDISREKQFHVMENEKTQIVAKSSSIPLPIPEYSAPILSVSQTEDNQTQSNIANHNSRISSDGQTSYLGHQIEKCIERLYTSSDNAVEREREPAIITTHATKSVVSKVSSASTRPCFQCFDSANRLQTTGNICTTTTTITSVTAVNPIQPNSRHSTVKNGDIQHVTAEPPQRENMTNLGNSEKPDLSDFTTHTIEKEQQSCQEDSTSLIQYELARQRDEYKQLEYSEARLQRELYYLRSLRMEKARIIEDLILRRPKIVQCQLDKQYAMGLNVQNTQRPISTLENIRLQSLSKYPQNATSKSYPTSVNNTHLQKIGLPQFTESHRNILPSTSKSKHEERSDYESTVKIWESAKHKEPVAEQSKQHSHKGVLVNNITDLNNIQQSAEEENISEIRTGNGQLTTKLLSANCTAPKIHEQLDNLEQFEAIKKCSNENNVYNTEASQNLAEAAAQNEIAKCIRLQREMSRVKNSDWARECREREETKTPQFPKMNETNVSQVVMHYLETDQKNTKRKSGESGVTILNSGPRPKRPKSANSILQSQECTSHIKKYLWKNQSNTVCIDKEQGKKQNTIHGVTHATTLDEYIAENECEVVFVENPSTKKTDDPIKKSCETKELSQRYLIGESPTGKFHINNENHTESQTSLDSRLDKIHGMGVSSTCSPSSRNSSASKDGNNSYVTIAAAEGVPRPSNICSPLNKSCDRVSNVGYESSLGPSKIPNNTADVTRKPKRRYTKKSKNDNNCPVTLDKEKQRTESIKNNESKVKTLVKKMINNKDMEATIIRRNIDNEPSQAVANVNGVYEKRSYKNAIQYSQQDAPMIEENQEHVPLTKAMPMAIVSSNSNTYGQPNYAVVRKEMPLGMEQNVPQRINPAPQLHQAQFQNETQSDQPKYNMSHIPKPYFSGHQPYNYHSHHEFYGNSKNFMYRAQEQQQQLHAYRTQYSHTQPPQPVPIHIQQQLLRHHHPTASYQVLEQQQHMYPPHLRHQPGGSMANTENVITDAHVLHGGYLPRKDDNTSLRNVQKPYVQPPIQVEPIRPPYGSITSGTPIALPNVDKSLPMKHYRVSSGSNIIANEAREVSQPESSMHTISRPQGTVKPLQSEKPAAPTMTNRRGESYLCVTCGNLASFLCSGCHQVWYCNVQCQGADWNKHNKACTSTAQQQLSYSGERF